MIKWRFNAAMPALYHSAGVRSGDRIEIQSATGASVFGPYIDVPAGSCAARILLDGPAEGQAVIDVASHAGTRVHASREVDLSTLDGNGIEISAKLAEPTSGLEVRLRGMDEMSVTVTGLEIDLEASSIEQPTPGRSTGWETSKNLSGQAGEWLLEEISVRPERAGDRL